MSQPEEPKPNLYVIYGAVSAARQALGAATVTAAMNGDMCEIEARLAAIDEDMRKLARDISRKAKL